MRQVIDSTGSVVNYYTYKPFGETYLEEYYQGIANPFRFTGQYYDGTTCEYDLRNRWYDPHIFRFTAYDPITGMPGEPLSLHKYLYCRNNPINYTDVNGKLALMLGGSFSGNFTLSNVAGYGLAEYQYAFTQSIVQYYNVVLPYYTFLAEHVGLGGTAGAGLVVAHNEEGSVE